MAYEEYWLRACPAAKARSQRKRMESREPGTEHGERANWCGVPFAGSEFLVLDSRFSICMYV